MGRFDARRSSAQKLLSLVCAVGLCIATGGCAIASRRPAMVEGSPSETNRILSEGIALALEVYKPNATGEQRRRLLRNATALVQINGGALRLLECTSSGDAEEAAGAVLYLLILREVLDNTVFLAEEAAAPWYRLAETLDEVDIDLLRTRMEIAAETADANQRIHPMRAMQRLAKTDSLRGRVLFIKALDGKLLDSLEAREAKRLLLLLERGGALIAHGKSIRSRMLIGAAIQDLAHRRRLEGWIAKLISEQNRMWLTIDGEGYEQTRAAFLRELAEQPKPFREKAIRMLQYLAKHDGEESPKEEVFLSALKTMEN